MQSVTTGTTAKQIRTGTTDQYIVQLVAGSGQRSKPSLFMKYGSQDEILEVVRQGITDRAMHCVYALPRQFDKSLTGMPNVVGIVSRPTNEHIVRRVKWIGVGTDSKVEGKCRIAEGNERIIPFSAYQDIATGIDEEEALYRSRKSPV